MWTQLSSEKGHIHPHEIFGHVHCGKMAGWMKTPLGAEVDLGPGHIVLDGVPAPEKVAQQPPLFSAHVYCDHGRPSQLLLSSCEIGFQLSANSSMTLLYARDKGALPWQPIL